jgi:histidinol-phosphatase
MSIPTTELSTRLESARRLADEMGRITLEYFGREQLAIDHKADGSIVTEADRAAEHHARSAVLESYPDDGLLGEEHGEIDGDSPWRWVIDPIDGTVSFARGVPAYGVLIGIEYEHEPVGGVIHLPAWGETTWGGRDLGAWQQRCEEPPRPARVSSTETLDEAMVCTTTWDYFRDGGCIELHDRLVRACTTRGWSDCSAHLLLATGRIDAVVDPLLSRWDICASIAVIEAAGGRVTDLAGQADPACRGAILSNGPLHEPLLALVSP